MKIRDQQERELLCILDEEQYVRLSEQFGGISVYVPQTAEASSLEEAVGLATAKILVEEYRGNYVDVPLSRALRAHFYKRNGMDNSQIARKLGMTRQGVQRIFSEADKRNYSKRQFELFASD